jgi:hypothetical protein
MVSPRTARVSTLKPKIKKSNWWFWGLLREDVQNEDQTR